MSDLSLDEILSLYSFNLYYDSPSEYFYSSKLIIDWAERQAMEGNDSETLLIIASLGLDKQIDNDDVINYLKRYLSENQIAIPDINYSCLVFIKIFTQKIIECDSLECINNILFNFVPRYIEYGNRCFHRIQDYWFFIYCDYFDMYNGEYCYDAKKQRSEKERYNEIKSLAERFHRLLNNKEMVEYLAKHV